MPLPPQNTERTPHISRCNIIWYVFFIILLVFCYRNSFQASWHFDDIANILLNEPLHLDDLSATSLKQTFFAYPGQPGKLLRPVCNLSFGLNWFFGQDNVFGYHLVNFCIHLISGILLYHTCLLFLATPRFGSKYLQSKYSIAGLAAVLWMINPVQTQAVTYIVQRNASLATLFYLAGLLSYLKARLLSADSKRSVYFYVATCLFYLLAIGSKENAVVFPAAIILIELLFFQHTKRLTRYTVFTIILGCAITLTCTLLLVGPDFFFNILNSYETRDFTPLQRILTEARIVLFYLSLLLFPSPFRMSITHDIPLSTSLLSPLSTLPSILILALLTLLPFIYYKKYPLLSFALLFFLLNHIVESTVIPLEMIFEHRNYLPSLFLFLPLATAFNTFINKYKSANPILLFTIIAGSSTIIILLTLGTISRNNVWMTERSLWTDSLEKAPKSARSYINLAHSYTYNEKNYQKAFQLCQLSLDKQSPTPWKDRLRAYNLMGNIMSQVGNYKQAIIFYDNALTFVEPYDNNTLRSETLLLKGKTQWLAGQNNLAVQTLDQLAKDNPDTMHFIQPYGEMLVAVGRKIEGITLLSRVAANTNKNKKLYASTLLDLSVSYGQQGDNRKAVFFYNVATLHNTPLLPAKLCLLENSIRTNNTLDADRALRSILSQFSWTGLLAILEKNSQEHITIPLDYPLLKQYVRDWLTKQSNQ